MGTQFSGGGSQYLQDAPSRQPQPSPASTPAVLLRLSDVRSGVAPVGRAETSLSQTFQVRNVGEPVLPDWQPESRAESSDSDVTAQDSKEKMESRGASRDSSPGDMYPRIAAACFGVVILFLVIATFRRPAQDEVGVQYTFPDLQLVDEESKAVRLRSPVTDQPSGESPSTTTKTYPHTEDFVVDAQAERGIPLSPARPPAENFKSITLGLSTRSEEPSSLGSKPLQEIPDMGFKSEPENVRISGSGQAEDVLELQSSQASSQLPSVDRNPSDSSDSGQPTGTSTIDWPQRKQQVLNKSHPGSGQMVTNIQDGSAGSTGAGYPQMLQLHSAPPAPRYPVTRPTNQYFQPRLDSPRDPLRTSQRVIRRRAVSGPGPVRRRRGAQLRGWLENPPIERSDEPYRSSLY